MKKLPVLTLIIPVTTILTASAHSATLLIEDFNDSVITYTQSVPDFSDGFNDFFGRVAPDGITVNANYEISGVDGAGYFAGMDLDGEGGPASTSLTFTVNIAGFENLAFSGLFAEDDDGSNQDWDADTSFTVAASIDGATPITIFGIEATGGTNTEPAVDTDLDGVGDGAVITGALTSYGASIAGTGSVLTLTFSLTAFDAGDEDIAFDNIVVTGDPIPEPTTALLGGLGLLALLRRRR